MKHSRETYKIAVAESSLILRSGIVSAIRRAADSEVQFLEITTPEELFTKLKAYAPNVLIINPMFSAKFDVTSVKSDKELSLAETRFIAFVGSLLDPQATQGYDGIIQVYDTAQTIHAVLDKVMGYDEPDIAESEEGQISQREKEIICEVVKGKTNKEIADELNISLFTVLTHRRNISRKLQIHSSTALAIYAITNKLVSISDVK